MQDKFQERYLEHQNRKTRMMERFEGQDTKPYRSFETQFSLKEIMMDRRSQRHFNNRDFQPTDLGNILDAIRLSPSSCNRQAITVKACKGKDIIALEKLLVGGTRWILEAKMVLLVFADPLAYKSPNEKTFMHYLDAGVCVQSVYLMAEVLNIGCCFVNPNIRPENQDEFHSTFNKNNKLFCGAIALGNYDKKAQEPPKRTVDEVIEK